MELEFDGRTWRLPGEDQGLLSQRGRQVLIAGPYVLHHAVGSANGKGNFVRSLRRDPVDRRARGNCSMKIGTQGLQSEWLPVLSGPLIEHFQKAVNSMDNSTSKERLAGDGAVEMNRVGIARERTELVAVESGKAEAGHRTALFRTALLRSNVAARCSPINWWPSRL